MIGNQGQFDPTGYIAGNPTTYPVPIGGDPYTPGQYWEASAAGTLGPDAVAVGDRIYVVSLGREYFEGTYGQAFYGWTPAGPWDALTVQFRPWGTNLPSWNRPAPPYTGCPLGDDFPGWRLVIEALFIPQSANLRRYGQLGYGDDVFGDSIPTGPAFLPWQDITEASFGVSIRVGNEDGNPHVNVSEARFDFTDEAATLFAMNQPESWFGPRVGTMLRVGVLAPSLAYSPLFTGRVERVEDIHDTPPRLVQVDAFGLAFDLVQTLPNWSRPTEDADVRLDALIAASEYEWAPIEPYPTPVPTLLETPPRSDPQTPADPVDVVARAEIDLSAISARWSASTDTDGRLRFRPWPDVGHGQTVRVSDCPAVPGELASPEITLVADMAELLNIVELSNVADTAVAERDDASVDYFGGRSESLGFPLSGLTTVDSSLAVFAQRVLDRYGRIVNRVASIEANCAVDPAWLEPLVDLDLGNRVHFTRRGIDPEHRLDGIVCGYEHRLTPNRWNTTINLTTTTPSI